MLGGNIGCMSTESLCPEESAVLSKLEFESASTSCPCNPGGFYKPQNKQFKM